MSAAKLQWRNFTPRWEFVLLAGTVAGALRVAGAINWGSVALLAVTIFLLTAPRLSAVGAVGLLLALAGGRLCRQTVSMLPDRPVAGVFEATLTDLRLSAVAGVGTPSLVRAKLHRFTQFGGVPVDCAETVYAALPDTPGLDRLRCGSQLRLTGSTAGMGPDAFEVDASGIHPVVFDFDLNHFLVRRGATRLLRVTDLKLLSPPAVTVTTRLLAMRDALLDSALRQLNDPMHRATAAALLFGCGGGLDRDRRGAHLYSGTIHLFSISGLHVAAVAAVILLLLRPLPHRFRYFALVAAVLLYVLAAGANPPALRAFAMIAFWALLRAGLYHIPAVNLLALAGAALIAVNPALVVDMGALYSLTITGVLLLAADKLTTLRRLWFERQTLLPPGAHGGALRGSPGWRFAAALVVAAAAFMGGAGISLYFQNLLLPGSVAANLALLPALPLVFAAAAFQILFGWIASPIAQFGAAMLGGALDFIGWIAGVAATVFAPAAAVRPGIAATLFFYAALFAALSARRRVVQLAALAVALAGPVFWIYRASELGPELWVATSDYGTLPAVVLVDPGGDTVAVNAPGLIQSAAAADFLTSRGIHRIDAVAFSQPSRRAAAGFGALERHLSVGRIELPPLTARNGAFLETLELSGVRRIEPGGLLHENFTIVGKKNGFGLEYFNPGSKLMMTLETEAADTGWRVTVFGGSGERWETVLPYSALPLLTRLKLRKA